MEKKTYWLAGIAILFLMIFAGVPDHSRSVSNEPNLTDSVCVASSNAEHIHADIKNLYQRMGLAAKGLSFETFDRAVHGFEALQQKGFIKRPLLSIVDMSQASCKKRLYIIDMESDQLLVNTLVAHGKNSGMVKASSFSNKPESLQSSLGFYVTGGTYEGGNGYSLRLKGMEKGFNDQAENRAIVMHGAPYVSEDIAKSQGRIGRSWGCPAVSMKEHEKIINLVKNGSCLFISAPQPQYLTQSKLAKEPDTMNAIAAIN